MLEITAIQLLYGLGSTLYKRGQARRQRRQRRTRKDRNRQKGRRRGCEGAVGALGGCRGASRSTEPVPYLNHIT
jgi:hypothetical protein